ncbi:hypothetical protein L6452_31853 [Arctium lappa]|uniref:Uncharacterized protein n=1 Tax=Arctium lappa TaxID=4217 RepID=A0ACB8Z309_ARCLA|nr:hypothetical protein L6452_31853 [Arctium lappa]
MRPEIDASAGGDRRCGWRSMEVWMTMTSHSGSSKLCANIKCRKPIQVTRSSWKCPNGCFVILCDRCS